MIEIQLYGRTKSKSRKISEVYMDMDVQKSGGKQAGRKGEKGGPGATS